MDFRSRGGQAPISPASTAPAAPSNNKKFGGKWLERSSIVLLFGIAILIAAIAGLTFFSGNSEAKAIKKDNYQAVFLNNGQVYFGHVKSLNAKYINLADIYYLQTNDASGQQATSSTNVSLVKLGCELHAPFDQMVINRDQVIFWENLKDSGQVVKAIAQYGKDNPNGQTCNTSSSTSTQQAPSTNTQSTTTPTTTPTPTPSSSTTKKP
jgi:hypothetical protein